MVKRASRLIRLGALLAASTTALLGGLLALGLGPASATTSTVTFTAQPTSINAGSAFGTITVMTTGGADAITLSVTGGAATISCTNAGGTTVTASGSPDTASFTGCTISTPEAGITLTATDGSSNPGTGTSNSFNVVGPPTTLVFSTQPVASTPGTVWSTQPEIDVEDSAGNLVTTSYTVSIAIASGTGTSGAVLSGCGAVASSGGFADFSGCSINTPGSGYELLASIASPPISQVSASFNLTGSPSKLVFITSPVSALAGTVFPNQPVVAVEDAYGDIITTDTSSITIALSPSASMYCTTNPATASGGYAYFSGCSTTTAGTFTLTATDTSDGITGTSAAFTVTGGTPAQLVFSTQPGSVSFGSAISPAPTATIEDVWDNAVTSDFAPITLSLGSNSTGATLSCSNDPLVPTSGAASFGGCTVSQPGTYTFVATDSTDGFSVTSAAFTVSSAATTTAASSSNPSTLPVGTSVTFTAKVSAASGANPTGTVTFSNGSTPISSCTSLALSSGTATCTTSFTSNGSFTINVAYTGAGSSLSSSTSFTQTVIKPTPKLSFKTTSASSKKASFKATYTGPEGAVSGTVVVRFGTKLVSSIKLKKGVASFTTSKLPAGKRTLSLRYAGSAVYAAVTISEKVKLS